MHKGIRSFHIAVFCAMICLIQVISVSAQYEGTILFSDTFTNGSGGQVMNANLPLDNLLGGTETVNWDGANDASYQLNTTTTSQAIRSGGNPSVVSYTLDPAKSYSLYAIVAALL
jgi:hypothetical protein